MQIIIIKTIKIVRGIKVINKEIEMILVQLHPLLLKY